VKNDPVLQNIHEKTLASVTELLDNGYKVTLAVTSAGDPFASKLYIDALQNYHHDSANYDYFIVTNGTLLTQKKLEWDNIRHRTRGFAISVDAATKETYAKVRRLGDFDQLTANLKNLNEQKRNGFFTLDPYITVNFVISSLNFRELPLFMEQMLELEQISEIWLNLIADWGHLNNFNDYAIWREDHPDHEEFLAVMQHPLLKSNKLKATNAMRFIHV
jgi:sulfatase maturation enzyme AslB (radical SAM superfamily)